MKEFAQKQNEKQGHRQILYTKVNADHLVEPYQVSVEITRNPKEMFNLEVQSVVLHHLDNDPKNVHIVYNEKNSHPDVDPRRVFLPALSAFFFVDDLDLDEQRSYHR